MTHFWGILFPTPEKSATRQEVAGRVVLWLFLVWYFRSFFTVRLIRFMDETPGFIHGIDLIFHEAGHIIFGVFGWPLLTAFGGTLMQCLVPFLLMIAFLTKNRDAYAAGIFLAWTGQNLVDCAPYINDARLLQLPLITGGTGREVGGHDWEFLLMELGWIEYDAWIARWVLWIGRFVMAAGLLWAAAVVAIQVRGWREPTSEGGG